MIVQELLHVIANFMPTLFGSDRRPMRLKYNNTDMKWTPKWLKRNAQWLLIKRVNIELYMSAFFIILRHNDITNSMGKMFLSYLLRFAIIRDMNTIALRAIF